MSLARRGLGRPRPTWPSCRAALDSLPSQVTKATKKRGSKTAQQDYL